jgi:hypothetical protein
VGAVANPGVYRIAGTSGSTVNITIGSLAAGGDFSFVPDEGCIVTYGTASAADSLDTCATFTADNVVTTRLSLATATEEGSAAPGVTVDGQLVFTVGGTITIGAVDLNPATVYTANFPVTVVY